MFYVMLSINPPSKNKPVQKLIAKYVFDCYEKRRSLVLQVNIDYSFTSAMCVMILNYLDKKSMYIGLCRTPNKALSCLVLSCLPKSGCIGTVHRTKYWRPYDPTTYICRRPWNRRWQKDFTTFQTESLLSQVAQFLKRRKFKFKLTEESGLRTSSDRDRASLSPCRFSSQVNLQFLISRRSFAKNSRAEVLFCLLSEEPY